MFSLEYLRRTSLLNGKEKLMGNIRSTISNIDKMSFIVVDRDGKEYKHFNKKDYDVKILDLVHPQNQTDIIHLLIYIMMQMFYLWLIHFLLLI